MNTTEIGILGPLRSKIEGNEVVLPGTKLRSIMAILAFRAGETVISDVLVEELGLDQSRPIPCRHVYPGCDDGYACTTLRRTSSRPRTPVIGSTWTERRSTHICLWIRPRRLLSQQVVGRIVAALAASGWAADDEGRLREFVQSAS